VKKTLSPFLYTHVYSPPQSLLRFDGFALPSWVGAWAFSCNRLWCNRLFLGPSLLGAKQLFPTLKYCFCRPFLITTPLVNFPREPPCFKGLRFYFLIAGAIMLFWHDFLQAGEPPGLHFTIACCLKDKASLYMPLQHVLRSFVPFFKPKKIECPKSCDCPLVPLVLPPYPTPKVYLRLQN